MSPLELRPEVKLFKESSYPNQYPPAGMTTSPKVRSERETLSSNMKPAIEQSSVPELYISI